MLVVRTRTHTCRPSNSCQKSYRLGHISVNNIPRGCKQSLFPSPPSVIQQPSNRPATHGCHLNGGASGLSFSAASRIHLANITRPCLAPTTPIHAALTSVSCVPPIRPRRIPAAEQRRYMPAAVQCSVRTRTYSTYTNAAVMAAE